MSEPIWLDVEIVIDIHAEQLAIFGGRNGIRDQACWSPRLIGRSTNGHYGQTDLAALAAAYAFGLARNHAFVDGNKRTAFHAMMRVSAVSTISISLDAGASATAIILSLAAGEVSEESLTRWIRDNWPAESTRIEQRADSACRRCSPTGLR